MQSAVSLTGLDGARRVQVQELLELEEADEERKYPSMGKWAAHVQTLHATVMNSNRA